MTELKKYQQELNKTAENLLTKYGNTILRFAYSYLHNLNDAEDIVQDTIIKYLETKPEFIDEAHEKAWMMRVSANLSKNKIKYNNIRIHEDINDIDLPAEDKEDYSDVKKAVARLPEQYREVIHLYYYEEYSTKEIANIINMRDSTIRTRLARGREKLKEMLKEAYDFEE